MMCKSAFLILVALTPAMASDPTTTTTTTTVVEATTTVTTVTEGATTTTEAPKITTTEPPKPNVTNTTAGLPSTVSETPILPGAKVIDVVSTADFAVGMEIVIGEGTAAMEFNSITGFGTIHLATPVMNHHPKGTTITEKKADVTTTTTLAPNPCIPTTTTLPKPCVPEVITTTLGPCETAAEVKYDAKHGALAAGNSMGMIGWGFAGLVGVAVAMFALRRNSRRAPTMSRVMNADLEYAMVEASEEAPQE